MQNLWGLLRSISLFFPMSNVFVQLIPIKSFAEDGSYRIIDPNLITALSTLVTLFVILDTFSKRKLISAPAIRRQAWPIFLFGISMLVLYTCLYFFPR